MQVDMFSDSRLISNAQRQRGHLAVRAFFPDPKEWNKDLPGLNVYFSDRNKLRLYKDSLRSIMETGRKVSYIGKAENDNCFILEALGLSRSAKVFSMIVDFSNCLDLILNRCYGCGIDDIRSIDEYEIISREILNCDFDNTSGVNFGKLMDSSKQLEQKFIELSNESKEAHVFHNDRLPWIIYQFYQEILSELADIKWYATLGVIEEMKRNGLERGTIHSSSYSSVAASVTGPINEMVTLNFKNGDDVVSYDVAFRSYRQYEYIGEVLRNDSGWKIQC